MEIKFPAPAFLLWIIIIAFVIIVPAMLLKNGKWGIKISALAFSALVCGLILFFFYRETRLTADNSGLYTDTYGKFSVKWTEIDKAFVIDELTSSDYKPAMRTNGAAYGHTAFGWFSLKNGETARVVLESGGKCLVVYANGKLYLFAPKDFDPFISFVGKNITLPLDKESE